MGRRPSKQTPLAHYFLALLVPLGPVAMVLRWHAGVSFFEALHGVPALACYAACGLSCMAGTVALVGSESNRVVALIGFVFGTAVGLAFAGYSAWRTSLLLWELIVFPGVAVLGAAWISYSFRTPREPEPRAPGLDDDLFSDD